MQTITSGRLAGMIRSHRRYLKAVDHKGDCADFRLLDLSHTKFGEGLDLSEACFYQTKLTGARLSDVTLVDADMRYADLWRAKLGYANLKNANLRKAELNSADLRGANFEGADLREAVLYGANIEGASFEGADLRGANLRAVKGFADFEGANTKDTEWGML